MFCSSLHDILQQPELGSNNVRFNVTVSGTDRADGPMNRMVEDYTTDS